jgi:muramoyltetrapeptide carboxypeptidase
MLKARALRSGDRLAVVAPASSFNRQEFEDGVAELRRIGFDPVFDEAVFARTPNGYLAGTAAERAAAIDKAWRDPAIAGLIGVRGGYGSAQVVPLLDVELARLTRKPLVGYSDLTAILNFLNGYCGVASFHGPMLAGKLSLGERGYDRASFERALMVPEPLGELSAPGLESLRGGEARGPILGGTVTQLLASLGTPWAFDPPAGYVLLFEEVGERPYRLDRMTTQLRQANLLNRASAIVIGELKDCDEPGGKGPSARAVMADVLADFGGPVLFGLPTGHTAGPAFTVPLGVECRVVADGRPRLIIEEAAVE